MSKPRQSEVRRAYRYYRTMLEKEHPQYYARYKDTLRDF